MKIEDLKIGETYQAVVNRRPEDSEGWNYNTFEAQVTVTKIGVSLGKDPKHPFTVVKDWGWVQNERPVLGGKHVQVKVKGWQAEYIILARNIKQEYSAWQEAEEAKDRARREAAELFEVVEGDLLKARLTEVQEVIESVIHKHPTRELAGAIVAELFAQNMLDTDVPRGDVLAEMRRRQPQVDDPDD